MTGENIRNSKSTGPREPSKKIRLHQDPRAAREAAGNKPPVCRIYEPHDYNAMILAKQRKRGVPANIPSPPLGELSVAYTTAIRPPVMKDPSGVAPVVDVLPELPEGADEDFEG